MIRTAIPCHIRTTFPALLLLFLTSAIAPGKLPNLPPVQVFILAGQSNMEGAGKIEGDPKRNGGTNETRRIAHPFNMTAAGLPVKIS